MSKTTNKTALVTGSNSGLGFEAAAQLAESGYSKVILAARSLVKAQAARAQLVERTGLDPFVELAMDVSEGKSVDAAVAELAANGEQIHAAILNAGLVAGSAVKHAPDGTEITVAASLTGHHRFTMGLLAKGLLATDARIIIAGSEAARGDVPGMKVTDIEAFAKQHHGGDRAQAIQTISKASAPYKYSNMSHYANAKVFVSLWAKALAHRLPKGMSVYSVSPGSAPSTNAMRNQNIFMKLFLTIFMVGIGRFIGLSAPVPKAARRYLDALDYDVGLSGGFFASRPGKMVGIVVEQTQPHILDTSNQEALWTAIVDMTGAGLAKPVIELAS